MSSAQNLEWCNGCQANVKPEFRFGGYYCPICGNKVKPHIENERKRQIPSMDNYSEIDLPGREQDIDPPELDVETGDLDLTPSDTVKTPLSGRLVLNPKVSDPAMTPLCPQCEEPIERFESNTPGDSFTVVEFRCGCDDLQRFNFPENEG